MVLIASQFENLWLQELCSTCCFLLTVLGLSLYGGIGHSYSPAARDIDPLKNLRDLVL